MKASSIEMGSREMGSYGRINRLLLLTPVYYSKPFHHAPLMKVFINTLMFAFLVGFILSRDKSKLVTM